MSTGRLVDAKRGLISLTRACDARSHTTFLNYELTEGEDGHHCELEDWTTDEVLELADFMIAQWLDFRSLVLTTSSKHEANQSAHADEDERRLESSSGHGNARSTPASPGGAPSA